MSLAILFSSQCYCYEKQCMKVIIMKIKRKYIMDKSC